MRKLLQFALLIACSVAVTHAQAPGPSNPCNAGNINASYSDIQNNVQYLCTSAGWKANVGNGAPTVNCGPQNYGQGYTDVAGSVTYQCGIGWFRNVSGGGGTLFGFSATGLSPLFTSTVTNSTTSPNLAFTLSNAAANTIFGNFTGSSALPAFTAIPTWNQPTTGNAATATALAAAPSLCGTGNAPTGILANGNATGCQAITGAGGGATLQVNGTNALSQSLQNLSDSSSVAFTNPSGGVIHAALVPLGANTILGFNNSNVLAAYTGGAGIAIVGGQIVNTSPASAGLTGSGSANCIAVFTGPGVLGCSTATDNGTLFSIAATNGLQTTGSTPAAAIVSPGTGNIPGLPSSYYGEVAPASGGTSYLKQWPATAGVGFPVFAAAATQYGANVAQVTGFLRMEATISGNEGGYGGYTVNTYLGGTKMVNAGRFTNLQITNTSTSSCTTPPAVNVQDVTTSTNGTTPVTASATGVVAGTTVQGDPGLVFAAGDTVRILISTAGNVCPNAFTVSAQYQVPQ